MKSGGSPGKGGEFERETNKKLSLWITRGQCNDVFRRNNSSGGAFTNAQKRGIISGMPGDTAGAYERAFEYPLAYEFLKIFFIEHKHWKQLNIEQALWKNGGEFDKVLKKGFAQATNANRQPMIIARQNYKPTLLFVPYEIGINSYARLLPDLIYHGLWRNRLFACLFEDALKVDPEEFMKCQ